MNGLIYPELSYVVQGAFYDVYNQLRYHELSEEGWEKALLIALEEKSVSAQSQVEYELNYKDHRVGRFFMDVLVDEKLLVELKVLDTLLPINEAQVIAYLKATGLLLGILVNFGKKKLQFKRIPNFVSKQLIHQPPDSLTRSSDHLLYPTLTRELRTILYTVHNELGVGFMHMHYRRAVQVELRLRDIFYETKKEVSIQFRGRPVETREVRLLIVDNKILLAPVAIGEITPMLKNRFRWYLGLFGLKLGLIANFHGLSLEIETVRI
jgi:GxxExxY protein